MFSYQSQTGMPIKDILKMPWIQFIIGMLDAPTTDLKSGKNKQSLPVNTAEEQINSINQILS
jgi:hypothetical protein